MKTLRKIPVTDLCYDIPARPYANVYYDMDGWAFHNIALQIEQIKEMDAVAVSTFPDSPKPSDADVVINLWYGKPEIVENAVSGAFRIQCVYDESLWTRDPKFFDLLARSAKSSHVLTGSSPSIVNRLRQAFDHDVFYCPDGVDLERFSFRGIQDGPLRVGWTGNSDPAVHGSLKGVHLIKEAMHCFPEIEFVLLDRRGKDSWTPHHEMPSWYESIDVILCMSEYEGTPNPVLEGAACGRPWISTNVGLIPEMGNSGIIVERSADALMEALSAIDKDWVKEKGRIARNVVERKFDWRVCRQNFWNIIREYQ